MSEKLERYAEHSGTIRIAGRTLPKEAGYVAFRHLTEGREKTIDFFFIGANAGHQAMKAMGVFAYLVKEAKVGMNISFVPLRVSTETKDAESKTCMKDATVWRTVLTRD